MSNKTEVLSFDKWLDTTKLRGYMDENSLEASWEAGQQSKQAEIDELQKRIDEIRNHVEINYDENRDDDSHSYWSGYNQALRELYKILKGEETK